MAAPPRPAEVLGRHSRVLLIGSGGLLWLISFPPFHLFIPPFVALVPFAWVLAGAVRPVDAARLGFLTGLLANALVMHWLPTTLWRHTPWALVLSLLLVVLASIGWGLVGWAVVRVWRRWPGLPRWLVFATCWTAYEVLLDHLGPWSFPWLGLGVSLTGAPGLIQIADLAGAIGITFWLAAVNGLLAEAGAGRLRPLRTALAVAGSLALVGGYGLFRERSLPLREQGRVALIQPNVSVDEKRGDHDRLVAGTARLTQADVPPGSVGLVVWPETSVPAPIGRHPDWGQTLSATTARVGTPLLAGALTEDTDGSFGNGALLVQVGGVPRTVYVKRRLVPVTEHWLVPGAEAGLVETPLGLAGLTICYESIFPGPFRRYRSEGSALAIVITNDAWFGRTGGAAQHAAHSVLRAVETRQAIVRVANSGYSFVVSPAGRVPVRTGLFEATTLIGTVWGGVPTPMFVRWGWAFGYVVVFAAVGLVACPTFTRKQRRPRTHGL